MKGLTAHLMVSHCYRPLHCLSSEQLLVEQAELLNEKYVFYYNYNIFSIQNLILKNLKSFPTVFVLLPLFTAMFA
jgi:hypothetical protein